MGNGRWRAIAAAGEGQAEGTAMASGIRVLGIDDSPFSRSDRDALVVGVVMRQGVAEAVMSARVDVDGNDATEKIISMISNSRYSKPKQLGCIMLGSIMTAGFNVVDINFLSQTLKTPVIAVTRKRPDAQLVARTLERIGMGGKIPLVEKAGRAYRHKYYMQIAGLTVEEAKRIIDEVGAEPLRLAHIIAGGVVKGESKGRM